MRISILILVAVLVYAKNNVNNLITEILNKSFELNISKNDSKSKYYLLQSKKKALFLPSLNLEGDLIKDKYTYNKQKINDNISYYSIKITQNIINLKQLYDIKMANLNYINSKLDIKNKKEKYIYNFLKVFIPYLAYKNNLLLINNKIKFLKNLKAEYEEKSKNNLITKKEYLNVSLNLETSLLQKKQLVNYISFLKRELTLYLPNIFRYESMQLKNFSFENIDFFKKKINNLSDLKIEDNKIKIQKYKYLKAKYNSFPTIKASLSYSNYTTDISLEKQHELKFTITAKINFSFSDIDEKKSNFFLMHKAINSKLYKKQQITYKIFDIYNKLLQIDYKLQTIKLKIDIYKKILSQLSSELESQITSVDKILQIKIKIEDLLISYNNILSQKIDTYLQLLVLSDLVDEKHLEKFLKN